MLYVLTGAIQVGKTRWLTRLIDDLSRRGVTCCGVLSPGIWREGRAGDNGVGYEKLGIETLLLPGGQRRVFARRRDLAEDADTLDTEWQSSRAALGWAIPDEALERVNRHFDAVELKAVLAGVSEEGEEGGLLVVDELGRLELEKEGGFTSAVRLLGRGPTALYRHALIVVRDVLAEAAELRFARAWGGSYRLSPDEESHAIVEHAILAFGTFQKDAFSK
jgi:nucleoside-triphosphatase THEP1